MELVLPALFLALLGALLSAVLVFASRKFAVAQNPLQNRIEQLLPQYNCGACGYPGCSQFAQYLVDSRDEDAFCPPGGPETLRMLHNILGILGDKEVRQFVAHVFCAGTDSAAARMGLYVGIADCEAADAVAAGTKVCPYGCLGLGSCVKACQFGAIEIRDGIAVIIEEKCVGCKACIAACPRKLIRMIPKGTKVTLDCSTPDKGAMVKRYCKVGCISCVRCVKVCPAAAIPTMDRRLIIDHDKCTLCGKCIAVCPQNTINGLGVEPAQEAEVQK